MILETASSLNFDDDDELPPFAEQYQSNEAPEYVAQSQEEQVQGEIKTDPAPKPKRQRKKPEPKPEQAAADTISYREALNQINKAKENIKFFDGQIAVAEAAKRDDVVKSLKATQAFLLEQALEVAKKHFGL